jgi:hypothetical protein
VYEDPINWIVYTPGSDIGNGDSFELRVQTWTTLWYATSIEYKVAFHNPGIAGYGSVIQKGKGVIKTVANSFTAISFTQDTTTYNVQSNGKIYPNVPHKYIVSVTTTTRLRATSTLRLTWDHLTLPTVADEFFCSIVTTTATTPDTDPSADATDGIGCYRDTTTGSNDKVLIINNLKDLAAGSDIAITVKLISTATDDTQAVTVSVISYWGSYVVDTSTSNPLTL